MRKEENRNSATQIRRMQSFIQLPLSLFRSHSLFAADVLRSVEEVLMIDEASPSEDERFAESNLHVPAPDTQCFQGTVLTNNDDKHSTSTIATTFRPGQGPGLVL